jgi:predicted O-methyltransferase YrrM
MRVIIGKDKKFSLGGENFVVNTGQGSVRRPSDAEAFTLVKNQAFLNMYSQLVGPKKPRGLLELGVFQGGSFVLLDKMFQPERMSAVEISKTPVEPLVDYCARTPGRSVHFDTSQADAAALTRIVDEDLQGQLDMVIDDASHAYDMTKASFEILWPRLAPGGLYVIEDWAWAHQGLYQRPDSPRAGRPALTNLLFEQIMLLGSNQEIAEIRIVKPLYILKKFGDSPARPNSAGKKRDSVWEGMLLRGQKPPEI